MQQVQTLYHWRWDMIVGRSCLGKSSQLGHMCWFLWSRFVIHVYIYQSRLDQYWIFYVAAKRSRLVTVTMDGKLDIWDFDVAGQVIFKDRSSENQPRLIKETTSDRVIGLKSCPFYHGLCMVLTRKNAIVSFSTKSLVRQSSCSNQCCIIDFRLKAISFCTWSHHTHWTWHELV